MMQTLLALEPALPAVIGVCFLTGLGLLHGAWRGLRGDRRAWAVPRGWIDFRSRFGRYPNLPFKAAAGGVSLLAFSAHTFVARTSPAPRACSELLLWITLVALLMGLVAAFWWPAFLGPRWYRQWRARGGHGNRQQRRQGPAFPYSQQELDDAGALSAGAARDRLMKDINNCCKTMTEHPLNQQDIK